MSSILPPRTSPYETANIPGPQMALSPDKAPTVFAAMVKRAKNPLLIVGKYVLEFDLEGKKLIEYAIEISKKKDIPIVATTTTLKGFIERNYPVVEMSLVDIVNRLQDPTFTVTPDKEPPHDLVLFLGITYQFASQGLSTLKHFAPHLRTITLCKWYHPNADWSFPNMDDKEWKKMLEEFIQAL
ncbi:CO dehydrogenase/acetyl-CoA synthase complex subunit epsilon [Candidatus Bathyarchaeota archaeon]|nr:MAG: CO dehydrogenase/acetyl-CoA synthase complex subunit epsilon [Candidatus Bathyarchaeota archaeon]